MTDRDASITFLTEYFHPEEASTAQLLTDLTTALTDSFEVSVLTGQPNYHAADRQRATPRRETHESVQVTRVPATRFDKDVLPLRLVNWVTFTLLVAVRLLREHRRDDAVVTLSNPPILPFAAWLHKRVTGTPYVYVIYDMYPGMAVELGYLSERNPITRLWARAMVSVYRDADRIVVLGESMRRRLETKMADDPAFEPAKIEVVPNWEDGEFIQPIKKAHNEFAQEHGTVEPFTLLYSGNIGRFHELRTAIDAIKRLEARGRTDIQLLIIGDGARKDELVEYVDRNGIENVRFLPFQPLDRLPETLTCGDASLVGIKPGMVGMCVSSKLYSSLAAGTPVLAAVGDGDEVARVVETFDCGAHVTPGNVEGTADVLARWADNPNLAGELGANARSCFEDTYTQAHAVRHYRDVLSGLVDG
jgi:glycosyltransferase involved in cell wall biosynthesis